VLHGVTANPYQRTRAATAGPDVVAQADPPPTGGQRADLAALRTLADVSGVTGHSGPYPLAQATVRGHGGGAAVQVEGRDRATTIIDQPKVTDGRWVREGGVVVERGFAEALGVKVGEPIVIDGRSLHIVGIAVSAATVPYPSLTVLGPSTHGGSPVHPGLVWTTVADARSLAQTPATLSYILNLKLTNPAAAPAFVDQHSRPTGAAFPPLLLSWQQIGDANANLVRNERRALLTGGWLLGLLALASIAVLVGGRMADQARRVGLLKAVGATPGLVVVVLLAQYAVLALLAAAAGILAARVTAPALTKPSAGLLGSAGAVPLTISTIARVAAVAIAVAVLATVAPALRAARTSTALALADSVRPPRRTAWIIALSSRLPVALLLGLRIVARRPRRTVLGTASIAITVAGIVAALGARAQLDAGRSGLTDPRNDRLSHVLALIMIVLIVQAAVNAIFITWANVLDARRSSALARALGATPRQVGLGLSAAQVVPAVAGAILGIPAGVALLAAVSPDKAAIPALWWLFATLLGTPLAMAALTALPARASARRSVAETLRSELA
ncbi:MAG: FtsX-like permease family protein, partial [Solirubrobacteraceae bacterium]